MIVSGGYAKNGSRVSPSDDIIVRWRELENDKWVRKESFEKFTRFVYIDKNNLFKKRSKLNQVWRDLPKYEKIPRPLVFSTIETHLWGIDVRFEEGEFYSPEGKKLTKVYLENPNDVYRFRKNFTPSFEADVPFEDQFMIEKMNNVPQFEMRKLFIDLEALQFAAGESPADCLRYNDPRDRQEINVIGAYDSFTERHYQWCMHPSYEEDTKIHEFDGDTVFVKYFGDEGSMLLDFVEFVDNIDPDVLLAWGMGFYDLPTLYRRLESLGIGADRLVPSSIKSGREMKVPTHKGIQYRWQEQPIPGRIVVSLDRLYERIYRDSKSTNLPSMKLDVVGQALFGRGKTEFRPDFYDADYDKFMDNYLYYNYRDVMLMVEIEASCDAIQGQQNLQALAKCQFKSTFSGSAYARVYFMRKADFKQKTGWGEEEEEWQLQGAIVLDPEKENSIGLHKNVVMLDFSGLYPSMMVAYNASWETKVAPGDESDDDIIGDGCRFKRNPEGILPKCVKELDVLRDDYKAKRAKAADEHGKASKEYKKWDDAQKTVKRLRATFYGLQAFQGYAWADIDIARTITYGGRKSLMTLKREGEKLGYPAIYGHTDSIFFKLGDDKSTEECAQIAIELGERLTKICQEEFQSDAVEVEAEVLMDRFYLPRRNRYAGRISWDPSLADPFSISEVDIDNRIKMQGLEAKHANTAKIGRDAQMSAIKAIWAGVSPQDVLEMLRTYIGNIREGKVSHDQMFSRARLGKWLPSDSRHPMLKGAATNPSATHDANDEADQCYKVLGGVHRAAAWYNVVLANDVYPKLDKGDSYWTTFVKDGPTWIPTGGYVAFQDYEQIENYDLDIETIIEKNVISKLDHIMYGIGLDNDMLRKDTKQLRIEDFV